MAFGRASEHQVNGRTRAAFNASPKFSLKVSNYFEVYDRLFEPFLGREDLVIVEFGVLYGGSLHMWRNLFGATARIIGVDLNPAAKEHELEGFEIYIANQENFDQIDLLLKTIGPIDILIDDGAHTNPACVYSLLGAFPQMKSGSIHVVEDLHTSFNDTFGNPSSTSAFSFGTALARNLSQAYEGHDASPSHDQLFDRWRQKIRSVEFFPSMMVVHFRTEVESWAKPKALTNGVYSSGELQDMRNSAKISTSMQTVLSKLSRILPMRIGGPLHKHLTPSAQRALNLTIKMSAKRRNRRLRKDLNARFGSWF